jgi:hypothetical protein
LAELYTSWSNRGQLHRALFHPLKAWASEDAVQTSWFSWPSPSMPVVCTPHQEHRQLSRGYHEQLDRSGCTPATIRCGRNEAMSCGRRYHAGPNDARRHRLMMLDIPGNWERQGWNWCERSDWQTAHTTCSEVHGSVIVSRG